MATTVFVSSLIADTRVMSGLRNNQLFTDDQIGSLIEDAADELHDIFVDAFEHWFQKPFDFTLTNGVNSVSLPSDFQKDNSLSRDPTTNNPEPVDMLGSWLERNQNTWGNGRRRYFISGDENGNQTLEIFPPASSAGDYRLFYTPQLPTVYPAVFDFTVNVASTTNLNLVEVGGPGPGGQFSVDPNPGSQISIDSVPLIGGSVETPPTTLVLLKDQVNQAQNGVFRCAESDAGGTTFYRLAAYESTDQLATGTTVKVLGGTVNAGSVWVQTATQLDIDVSPLIFTPPALPQVMAPWAVYLKTHAAIAIKTSRGQDASELESKLTALKARAGKAVKNKTEAPKQAPMTHHRRNGYGWR